jgi:hypothetical protein
MILENRSHELIREPCGTHGRAIAALWCERNAEEKRGSRKTRKTRKTKRKPNESQTEL